MVTPSGAPRILVVDDDRPTLLVLTRLLQKAGYVVLNAQETMQAVMQAHREQPALILTDLMMPAGGGLSLVERLALSSRTNMIPIVVLTASADPDIEARALEAGASRVLRKPCDGTVLLETISAMLDRRD